MPRPASDRKGRRSRVISLLPGSGALGAFFALLLLVAFVAGAGRAAPVVVSVPREVLAFYYGWWGTPEFSGRWVHWSGTPGKISDTVARYPTSGPYDSHDPRTVDRQFEEMRNAGITGLISSWWGVGTFEDASLAVLTREAPAFGLKVSAYYETVPTLSQGTSAAVIDAVVRDIDYLLDHYGNADCWLRVGNRPVIFVFRRAIGQIGLAGWWSVAQRLKARSPAPFLVADVDLDGPTSEVLSAFGGVHAYNNSDATGERDPATIARWAKSRFPRWAKRWQPALVGLTAMPGFGNARAPGNPVSVHLTSRFGGATYAALGEAAVRADPNWLLITSWNEWHEGTEIEPSVEFNQSALDETRRLSAEFRALRPRRLKLMLR